MPEGIRFLIEPNPKSQANRVWAGIQSSRLTTPRSKAVFYQRGRLCGNEGAARLVMMNYWYAKIMPLHTVCLENFHVMIKQTCGQEVAKVTIAL